MELDINPRWESEEQELVDMLSAISMVSRHQARKVEQASALKRGEGLPCYRRPFRQTECSRDGKRQSQQTKQTREEEKDHYE